MKINIQDNQLQLNHPIAISIKRGVGKAERFIWHLRRETTLGYYCTEQKSSIHDAYEGQFFPKESNHGHAHPVRLLKSEYENV